MLLMVEMTMHTQSSYTHTRLFSTYQKLSNWLKQLFHNIDVFKTNCMALYWYRFILIYAICICVCISTLIFHYFEYYLDMPYVGPWLENKILIYLKLYLVSSCYINSIRNVVININLWYDIINRNRKS